MAKSTRRIAGRLTPEEFDLPRPQCLAIAGSPEDQNEAGRTPEDPAHVALGLLLSRALDGSGLSDQEAGRDGIVVLVSVPAAGWVSVAVEVWKARMRGSERYQDGFYERGWLDERWCAWAVEKADRHTAKDGTEFFARAVANGQHCAAFAADPAWLPADIAHGADHSLMLPLLTGAEVSIVAHEVCGGDPADALSDGHAAVLTPRLLRLARRPGQDADAYLRKLRGLVEREAAAVSAAPKPTGSPRDTPTLDQLHGLDEPVGWGRALARDLAAYRAGSLPWTAVDRGCLLSGPPGTGKTLFARALAATCDLPLITGSYGEWLGTGGGHQGDMLRAMRRSFRRADAGAQPAVHRRGRLVSRSRPRHPSLPRVGRPGRQRAARGDRRRSGARGRRAPGRVQPRRPPGSRPGAQRTPRPAHPCRPPGPPGPGADPPRASWRRLGG